MSTAARVLIVLVILGVLAGAVGLGYVRVTGLKGQPAPSAIEATVARTIRSFAVPGDVKARTNPLANNKDALAPGLEHFAKYCAMCHDNDGSNMKTAIGGGLYPKPPDLRAKQTQDLTDGEIFYIIENGVRFTGMPAFGSGKPDPAGDKQVWELVYFVRHLPKITQDEIGWMESLNPF